jgi:hypothetical protein
MNDAERIAAEQLAAGLSDDLVKALLRMRISPPPSFMPNYHAVSFYGGDLPPGLTTELHKLGLATIIMASNRFNPTYSGEIHLRGRQVRAILEQANAK